MMHGLHAWQGRGIDRGSAAHPASIQFADSASIDSFSRLRVSEPVGLFSEQCQYDAAPLIYEAGNTGTGVAPAHNANTRMVALSATAGSGTSFLQSYEYVPYQAGKSQLIFVTGLLDTGVAGAVVDTGTFDAANGVGLRQNGASGLQFFRRTSTSGSVVTNTVDQSSWNEDKLDGSGRSGITLDVTKVFFLVIDAQFLAMGRVRFGFDIDGVIVWAHHMKHANVIAVPYMQTLTLPIQMLITATSTGSTKTCYFKCASVSSEGGFADDLGYTFGTPEGTVSAGSGARTHILSIRPRRTFNSLANRSRFKMSSVECFVTGTNSVFWELCIGSTFSVAPTFANVNATYSAFEYGTGGTLTAAGTVIATGYIGATATAKFALSREIAARYPISLDRAGAVRANGTMSLIVTGLGGASATRSSFNYTEIR